jgi:predicted nucleotidyltransferase
MGKPKTDLSDKKISKFFRHNHILNLSVLWSHLRGNKTADSDIEIPIEFDSALMPGCHGCPGGSPDA